MTCQNAIHRLESPVYFFIIFSSSIDDKLDSLLGLGQDKPPPNILFILSNPVQYHNKNRIYGGIGGVFALVLNYRLTFQVQLLFQRFFQRLRKVDVFVFGHFI